MKSILVGLIFASFTVVILGAQFRKINEIPGVCTSEEVGTMKAGESKTVENKCKRAACGETTLVFSTCPRYKVDPACKIIPEDLSKEYPACCNSYKCPDDGKQYRVSGVL